MRHVGSIIKPSSESFDAGGSTFCCAFVDQDDPRTTYLYYTGASEPGWSHYSIGLAMSSDGQQFNKVSELNPLVDGKTGEFNSQISLTPAVVKVNGNFYMFFAGGRQRLFRVPARTSIGVAFADDPRGPWTSLGEIAKPDERWEGWGIDLGPSIVNLGEGKLLIYYSNVHGKFPVKASSPVLPKYLRRHLGVLRVSIRSRTTITAQKYRANPLRHLNGPQGSPSESLFCPGYFSLGKHHILLPSMSTYSLGFPFRQYVGIVTDSSPFFVDAATVSVLIDGPAQKSILEAKTEIALDTPSPVLRRDELYLYYSAMDRADGIWKIALSIIDKHYFDRIDR